MTKYEIVDAIIATKYPLSHTIFFFHICCSLFNFTATCQGRVARCVVWCVPNLHTINRGCVQRHLIGTSSREKRQKTLLRNIRIYCMFVHGMPVLALKMSDVFFIIYFVIDFTPSIIRLGSILVTGLIDSSSQSKPQATAQTTVIINCHCVIIMFIMCCACARACSDAN